MPRPRSTIHFVSLGCPKNRVDSEVMLGVAHEAAFRHVDDPSAADVIVVNTCGFIDTAKRESIDTILEMAEHRRAGRCRKLVVAGCLVQRHPDELAAELPEVDHFLGSSDMRRLDDLLAPRRGVHEKPASDERLLVGHPADWLVSASDPRVLSSRGGSAYVKIAEGCNRKCAFCVIPELRGKQRSRTADDVVREVESLVDRGVKEVNLVSQDTVAYGRDLGDGADDATRLAPLVARVADVPGVRWVRLFYLYPERLDQALVELLAHHPRVLPYVDMPLQHAADAMLRRMRRGHGGARLRELVARLRRNVPGLTFRTAFIVGHPGETSEEFDELCDFVREAEFERLGVFRYSDEESAQSHALAGKVSPRVAENRRRKLMALGRRISRKKNERLVGQELEVLVEGSSPEHDLVLVGRHRGQAPEIDGQVFLSGTERLDRPPRPGDLLSVQIAQADDYDLVGEVVAAEAPKPSTPRRRLTMLGV